LSLEVLRRLDARGTAWLRGLLPDPGASRASRPVRAALAVIAHSGDSLVLVPLLGLLWWREGFAADALALSLAAAFLLSVLLTTLLKYVVRRSRPRGDWGAMYRKTDPHSFPSGHASRTAAMTLVALARGLPGPGLLLAGWSLLVGFARVALGVHYLLDVAAGYLLGLAIGAAVAFWLLHGLRW
jgi:membrane-associated phospholipid phosphatase